MKYLFFIQRHYGKNYGAGLSKTTKKYVIPEFSSKAAKISGISSMFRTPYK